MLRDDHLHFEILCSGGTCIHAFFFRVEGTQLPVHKSIVAASSADLFLTAG